MNIETIYPYLLVSKSGTFGESENIVLDGYYTHTNQQATSGHLPLITDDSDATYIHNSGMSMQGILLYFKPQTSSFQNKVDSAILRLRVAQEYVSASGYASNNSYIRRNREKMYYLESIKYSPNDTLEYIDTPDKQNMGGQFWIPISEPTPTTVDTTLNISSIDSYKDAVILLGLPSGTKLYDAKLILVGEPSNGMSFTTLGYTSTGGAQIAAREASLTHDTNGRFYGVDDTQTAPSSIFTKYDNFSSINTSAYEYNTGYYLANSIYNPTPPKNIYTNPATMTNGVPYQYKYCIYINGSGTYPSAFNYQLKNNFRETAYTLYLNYAQNDNNRILFRDGIDATSYFDNVSYKINVDNDLILFSYYDLDNTYKFVYLDTNIPNFSDFTNGPVGIIISYSGEALSNTYPSGTWQFYVENKQNKVFQYVGSVSRKINRALYGSSYEKQTVGGYPGFFGYGSQPVNCILSEVGYTNNIYVSGYKQDSGLNVMDDSRFERLVTDRLRLERFIAASGDSKYIRYDIPEITSYSGHIVDNINFTISSGDSTYLQMIMPRSAHYGNEVVSPSSVYVHYRVENFTSHPSGTDIIFNINAEYDGGSGFISFEKTMTSGVHDGYLTSPKVYGFDYPVYYNNKGLPKFTNLDFNIIIKQHGQSQQDKTYASTVKIDYAKLIFDNVIVAETGNNELPLYTNGAYLSNNNIDLYTESHIHVSDNMDLYLYSTAPSSGNLNLFTVYGEPINNNLTLYTNGVYADNSAFTLYMPNTFDGSGTRSIPMYLWSTANSGVRKDVTLMLDARYAIIPEQSIPLFIDAGSDEANDSLPLYLESHYDSTSNNLTLYGLGPQTVNSGVDLYVCGLGTTSGSIPVNTTMPLFINRPGEDSTANVVAMYTSGPSGVTNNLSVYIFGAYIAPSSITLMTEGSPISKTNTVKLYTHGF